MKTLVFLLLLATPLLAHAADLHPGDSLADVQAALGAPIGQAQLGNKLILDYERGQVQLVDGKVIDFNFLSPKAFAAQQAQQKADEAKAVQLKAQHIAEEQALKAQKLADPNFTSAPPAYQVSFWQDFRRRYPEVSCDDEYKLALARQQEAEQKVAALEARVADAEDRAARAENMARQANYNASISSPYFIGSVPRERFREREDEDHDRDDHLHRTEGVCSPSSIPQNQTSLPTPSIIPPVRPLNLPTFPIPPVLSLNLSTPNPIPQP
ncbi:MAG TPA: hypothetical protein VNW30_10195 [Opitutaceae bacterium]|jgi:hypothetical protein|nr:hypothetical protein [Opitutaceae bacterium]